MNQSRKPLPALTGRERNIGFGYLLFQLFLLPILLQGFNVLLPFPLGAELVNFLFFSINAIAVSVIFSRLLKKSLLRAKIAFRETVVTAIGGLALYWLCLSVMTLLLAFFLPDFVNLNDSSVAQLMQENFWLTAIGAVLLVPLAEETLHRGLVFGILYPKNAAAAYILSSALFSAIHVLSYVGLYEPLHLLLAFMEYLPAGLILAYAYRHSGTLLAPMLIHAAINAVAILTVR